MSRAGRTPQLDGLRAFAIGLVIVSHIVRTMQPAVYAGKQATGEIGVSVFFVLSGYLITSLLLQESARTGSIDLLAFYVRRARRIFPAFYVFLGIMALLAGTGVIAVTRDELLVVAFYLKDYYVHSFVWLEHTWSLAVETQFYLLWPAMLLLLGNRRAKYAAIVCVFAGPIVRVISYVLFPSSRDLTAIAFHTRFDMLAFGCATALIIENGVPSWLSKAVAIATPLRCLLSLAICVVATAFLRGTFQFIIGMSVEGTAIALLLVGVLLFPSAGFASVLRAAPIQWVGRISYSLYLWQQPFLFPLNTSFLGSFPLNIVLTFGAACLSYYVVERAFFSARPVRVVA